MSGAVSHGTNPVGSVYWKLDRVVTKEALFFIRINHIEILAYKAPYEKHIPHRYLTPSLNKSPNFLAKVNQTLGNLMKIIKHQMSFKMNSFFFIFLL